MALSTAILKASEASMKCCFPSSSTEMPSKTSHSENQCAPSSGETCDLNRVASGWRVGWWVGGWVGWWVRS
jgi:hypothetical protein